MTAGFRSRALVAGALLLTLGSGARAQWPTVPDKGVPRRADGRVDLDAPAPRHPDGTKPGEIPFQPWAEALYKQRRENNAVDHPGARCLPSGIPEKNTVPATEALRVTERFERKSVGRMDLLVTIDDPKAYTRPWTVDMRFRLLPDGELIEHICEENNRDLPHMVGKKGLRWKSDAKSSKARPGHGTS